MKTRTVLSATVAAVAITAFPAAALAGGNGIECISPADGSTHQSPGTCVKTLGFNGPGLAAQYFNDHPEMLPTDVADPLLEDGRITAGELVDLNCTTPKERR